MQVHKVIVRTVAAGLAGVLALTLPPPGAAHAERAVICANAAAEVFADVVPGSTHAAAIDCLAAHGITVGVGGGNYDPTGWVSRAQMASFLVRFVEVAADAPQPAVNRSPFTDVRPGSTHAGNIHILAELDVTRGRTATTYAPDAYVTRGQMATFVTRALRIAGVDLAAGAGDTFADDDGSSHEHSIDALAGAGVVRGVAAGRFDPNGYVSRAQMATFLTNAAGLLSERGQWLAPELVIEGARVVLVTPVAGESDMLEIRWAESVAAGNAATAFTVVDEGGETLVATGSTVTTVSSDTLRVTLDTALTVGNVYWLRAASGAVTDTEGTPSHAQQIAFTFTSVGGGGGGSVDAEAAPSIVSLVTAPPDTIRVTFDAPVTCPTGVNALAAWSFTNTRTSVNGLHPDSVTQATAPATSCDLVFAGGIVDGDHGTLTYTQPATADHQVRAAGGTALETSTNVDVKDGVAPTFNSLSGFAQTAVLLARFSEPIACLSVSESEFAVEVGGTSVDVVAFGCSSPSSSMITLTLDTLMPEGQVVSVTTVPGTTLADASLDNRVPSQTRTLLPTPQS